MNKFKNRLLLGLTTIILLTFTSCDDNDDYVVEQNTTSVKLSSDAALGSILVDGSGNSLYFFSKDTKEISNCNDGCLDAWPIFYDANISVSTGLDLNDFSTITRADGSKQTTYKNWPLYTFANNTNNFTASDFGNNGSWPIVEITLDQIPSTLSSDGFGTIDVFGRTQLTYKGWPLYYFGADTERGDNKGVSVPNPGVWPIVNKNIAAAL